MRKALTQIVTLPGLGHYPSEENPTGFLAIADRFLAQIPHGK
jgi:pimeloyl-ACP methyl ester carboxylesterase